MIINNDDISILRSGSDFSEWDTFIKTADGGSIFCASWWLDALCEAEYYIVVAKNNNKILGGLPVTYTPRHTYSMISNPQLTKYLGIVLPSDSNTKYETALSTNMEIATALLKYLPNVDYLYVNHNPSFTNWLPYLWNNYRQTVLYTYIFPDTRNTHKIFTEINVKTRNDIISATRNGVRIIETDDIDRIDALLNSTFNRKNESNPVSKRLLHKLHRGCKEHEAFTGIIAIEPNGRDGAGAYLVHDSKYTYYLLAGSDNNARSRGAASLVVWNAVLKASERGVGFDFEGSMIPAVEHNYRNFGAKLTPYSVIYKDRRNYIQKGSHKLIATVARKLATLKLVR